MMNYLFNKFKKYYCNKSQLMLWFLFLLVVILTLTPFLKIGLTTTDDLEFYIRTLQGDIFAEAFSFAKWTGRFYMMFMKPVYCIPYLIDNFYYTKIVQYGTLLTSFVLFAVTVNKIFKNKEFTLLIFLLLFTFLTVMPNYHIPILAHPFYFTCSFSIFLLSLLRFIKYEETKKYKFLIHSVILFGIALLFYENYIVFLLFMLSIITIKDITEQGWMVFTKKPFYKKVLPFFIVVAVYVFTYYVFRICVETETRFYIGSIFVKDFNFKNFFTVLWNYNRAAFPTYMYHESFTTISIFSLLPDGHQHNFWYILKNSQIQSIINSLLQCYLFAFLLNKVKLSISWKKIGIGTLIAMLFTFSVHILLAITEKYQVRPYWRDLNGYVTTFYSYFCITLLVGFIAYACVKISCTIKWLKISIIGMFTFLIFCIIIIISYSNDHQSRAWQQDQNKLTVMDKALSNGVYENTLIYAKGLNSHQDGYGLGFSSFWKDYLFVKMGKNFNIHTLFNSFENELIKNPQQDIYYICYFDSPKTQDVLLVLSKINNESIKLEEGKNLFNNATANEAKVYYYSANKDFIFQFVVPQCSEESKVVINNEIRNISNGINAIRIENDNKKKAVVSFTLKSDSPFLVKSFAVSNIGFVNEESVYLYDY